MPGYNSWNQTCKQQSLLQRAMLKRSCACMQSCSKYNTSKTACSVCM